MRRPVVVLVGTLAILVTLGLPFLRVSWGGIDARALPAGTETRVVSETMTDEFPANFTNPLRVIVTLSDPVSSPAARAALSAYTGRVEAVPGITGAQLTGEAGRTARIELTYSANRMSAEARDVVRKVRAVPPPAGASVLVGGPPRRWSTSSPTSATCCPGWRCWSG
ncbi:hypothetical protein GCM10027612_84090 [Microbispora bryophytorum subsp. camponoti]